MAYWAGGDRRAYYRFLRTVYRMDAASAWDRAKRAFDEHPTFMANPVAAVQAALSRDPQ